MISGTCCSYKRVPYPGHPKWTGLQLHRKLQPSLTSMTDVLLKFSDDVMQAMEDDLPDDLRRWIFTRELSESKTTIVINSVCLDTLKKIGIHHWITVLTYHI